MSTTQDGRWYIFHGYFVSWFTNLQVYSLAQEKYMHIKYIVVSMAGHTHTIYMCNTIVHVYTHNNSRVGGLARVQSLHSLYCYSIGHLVCEAHQAIHKCTATLSINTCVCKIRIIYKSPLYKIVHEQYNKLYV